MRLLTWNVNGLRAVIQYHPWYKDKSYQKILLDTLEADIICFQETKITLDKLEATMAIIPGYDAYFSFTKDKTARSGVVTYVKTNKISPIAAEEGISGILNEFYETSNTKNQISKSNMDKRIESTTTNKYGAKELLEIDSEGRCVLLDFKFFVLFNVYCPHESNSDRLTFKMKFFKVLQNRVEALLNDGRQVIIIGDINITHQKIDHCDPQKAIKDQKMDSFEDHPARKWFDGFLAPNGPMIDLFRIFHPNEEGMYTCWNTLINARPANYGTRLDYILVSKGMVKWMKSCDVKQQIMGSDHCPVSCELYDEIEENGKKIRLSDLISSNSYITQNKLEAPKLCAKYLSKFFNQTKLQSFFNKSNMNNDEIANVKIIDNSNNEELLKNSMDEEIKKIIKENSSEECIEDDKNSEHKSDIMSQWNMIFMPKAIPKCKVHGEPCKKYRVNKNGPNEGRYFFSCSRLVGSSPENQCDYFEWARNSSLPTKRLKLRQDDRKSNKIIKKQTN
ncbi:7672_t:CDS:2 [Entrophospora sp. SA101]|nr:7672_t:CDS:2 [Entrophospora sp. SA101]